MAIMAIMGIMGQSRIEDGGRVVVPAGMRRELGTRSRGLSFGERAGAGIEGVERIR